MDLLIKIILRITIPIHRGTETNIDLKNSKAVKITIPIHRGTETDPLIFIWPDVANYNPHTQGN